MQIEITQVKKGDIVRFKSYALRVESEPVLSPGKITLHGRKSIDGCPLVTRKFIAGLFVNVDRI